MNPAGLQKAMGLLMMATAGMNMLKSKILHYSIISLFLEKPKNKKYRAEDPNKQHSEEEQA